MKTMMDNYREIKAVFNEVYAVNTMEGVFVSKTLWRLPESWIKGLADFVRELKGKESNEYICSQLLHDIGGYVNKDTGFSPRCFKGGNVWDLK